jgi:AAA15 family ATPase/GTPase
MVVEIRLSNFFSIKDEIILDLRAANIRTENAKSLQRNVFDSPDGQLLKTVALYGANASGKSNIIKAIQFCFSMIFYSHNNNQVDRFNFVPFKFDDYLNKPSTFFIKFIAAGVEYDYSFSLTIDEIITESLYYYPNGRRAEIFTRDERRGRKKRNIYSFQNAIRKPLDVAENTSKKTLYISRASQMDRELPQKIFHFLYQQFKFGSSPVLDGYGVELMFKNHKKDLLYALQIADSDIVDVKMRKEEGVIINRYTNLPEGVGKKLIFTTYHRYNPTVAFDLDAEESRGTRMLFHLILQLLDVVQKNGVMVIDEMDLCLHSKIVEYIVNLFHASRSAQLIFTTHNTHLLDLKKMRKDQIWFANKKDDASTDLYSLFDYKDFRDTMDLEKAYMQGRFDAIPFIDDSAENLKKLTK